MRRQAADLSCGSREPGRGERGGILRLEGDPLHLSRCKGVKAEDPGGISGVHQHKRFPEAPAAVLAGLLSQNALEGFHTAAEGLAVVAARIEPLFLKHAAPGSEPAAGLPPEGARG
jgi:hypothetical protein